MHEREKFKDLIKEAIREKAFCDLKKRKEDRNSENSKGKLINYDEFKMADYLTNTEEDVTIEEQKWIFKCRVEDMKIKGNQRWKYEDISCPSCMTNVEETQSHILVCDFLLGKNENISYIPEYGELYNGDIKELEY